MQKVVAYLGKSVFEFKQAVYDIARNFDIVLFPMSEEHESFYALNLARMTEIAHQRGLKVWISPWGVLGIFGGEGVTQYSGECPYKPHMRKYMYRWIEVVRAIGADGIHFDEPRQTCCDISAFIVDAIAYAQRNELETSLYINSELWEMGEPLPANTTLWDDAYNSPHKYGDGVWIRGFSLRKDTMQPHLDRLQEALNSNLDYVGLWGYNGCTHLSMLASDPEFWWKAKEILCNAQEIGDETNS